MNHAYPVDTQGSSVPQHLASPFLRSAFEQIRESVAHASLLFVSLRKVGKPNRPKMVEREADFVVNPLNFDQFRQIVAPFGLFHHEIGDARIFGGRLGEVVEANAVDEPVITEAAFGQMHFCNDHLGLLDVVGVRVLGHQPDKHEMNDRVEFTDEEIEQIKLLIVDRGFEYALQSDNEKIRALAKKLGMDKMYCEGI